MLEIVGERGKMQNPETGSGGMLVGTVEEVGERSPLGLRVGDRVATLVSLTLTPLVVEDGLARWDGRGEQVPCDGYAVLFGRSIAAVIPDDLDPDLSLSVMDVCGAPALTTRVVGRYDGATVAVIGAAGKSGSLSLVAAKEAGAARTIGVVPHQGEADLLTDAGIADEVVIADARDPVALRDAVVRAGGPADVTVVCVDVPGCEGGAILATAEGGTVIFFSMATSFSAAALGAEGLAADVTMLVGNGYTPGPRRARAAPAARQRRGAPALRAAALMTDPPACPLPQRAGAAVAAAALAVEDDRIAFVGDDDRAAGWQGAGDGAPAVVDLDGALLTPGLRRRARAHRAHRLRPDRPRPRRHRERRPRPSTPWPATPRPTPATACWSGRAGTRPGGPSSARPPATSSSAPRRVAVPT